MLILSGQELALYLLESGAYVNSLNASGCTPLFFAVEGLHKGLCHVRVYY